jgi:HEAT repeat protein
MRSRSIRTGLIVLGVLSLGTAPRPRSSAADAGVRYQGRLASQWIAELRDPDVAARRTAVAAVVEVEPGIDLLIPALGELLQDPDAEVRLKAVGALGRLRHYYVEAFPPLLGALRNTDPEVRLAAVEGLEPPTSWLSDCRVEGGMVHTVRHRDVETPFRTVREVAAALSDEEARVRVSAARVVSALCRAPGLRDRPAASIAVPALKAALSDADAAVRGAVLDALETLDYNNRDLFLAALDDPDPLVRWHAAIGQAQRRPVAGRTIPLLAEILSSGEVSMQRRAIDALRVSLILIKTDAPGDAALETDRAAARAGLRAALRSEDEHVLVSALHAVSDLGPLATPLIPAVREVQEKGSTGPRGLASSVLERIAPAAGAQAPAPAAVPASPAPSSLAPAPPAAFVPAPMEPSRLEDFVRDLENPDAGPRFRAVAELFNMNKQAQPVLPVLLERFAHYDPWVRVQVLGILEHLADSNAGIVTVIVEALKDPSPAVRFRAAALLCRSFPQRSEPAIPVLMQMVFEEFPPGLDAPGSCSGDSQQAANAARREAAFGALGRVPAGTPGLLNALTRLLDSGPEEMRAFAAGQLARIGADAGPARGTLTKLLADPSAQVRSAAAVALARGATTADTVGSDGEGHETREALVGALLDPSPTVRAESARGLGAFGPAAVGAVPALMRTVKDPEIEVRIAAVEALGAIGRETQELVDLLAWAALQEGDAILRKAAAATLWKVDSHLDRTLPRFLHALGDPETFAIASEVLETVGPGTRGAAKPLREALGDSSSAVRRVVAATMGRLAGAEGSACVAALAERVAKDDDLQVRFAALEALRRIGPGAGGAVPTILAVALNDPGQEIRWQAALVFWHLGPSAGRAIPAIVDSIGDNKSYGQAISLMQTIAGKADELDPPLIQALSHPNPLARRWAAMALGRPGQHTPAAVPALILAGKTRDLDLRLDVMNGLGNLGLEAAPAVPFLADALADRDESARMVAALTLAKIGPAAHAAREALLATRDDESSMVRDAVGAALEAIGP